MQQDHDIPDVQASTSHEALVDGSVRDVQLIQLISSKYVSDMSKFVRLIGRPEHSKS